MMKKFIVAVVAVWFHSLVFSQGGIGSADIYLGLKKLKVLGSVLYIAAHPDDENTRLITYLSKDRLYRTGYLSLTRGDGGQNLIGDEQGVELGLLRTQELLSARRIDGGEQFFTRAYDFGFSKTPAETFTKWPKEKILSDVVWVIRQFQPDVIITRFPTTGEGGHGHHTASAILAMEAFQAAADPKKFPEQLDAVSVWQTKRILWNGFGGNSQEAFRIDVGGFNAILGKSYGEIAAESRSQHKSQGFGSAATRGEAIENFRTLSGSAPSNDLLDDVQVSWSRVGAPQVEKEIDNIISRFDFIHPELSLPALAGLYNAMTGLKKSTWVTQKLGEVRKLIELCSGLYIDVFTSEPYVAQTDSLRFNVTINNRLGGNISLVKMYVDQIDSTFNIALRKNRNEAFSKSLYVLPSKPVTIPFWLMQKQEPGYFVINDRELIGKADPQPAFTALFDLTVEGIPIRVTRNIRYRFTDPVKGEVYQPLYIVPPVSITHEPLVAIVKPGADREIDFQIKAYKTVAGRVESENPATKKITVINPSLRLNRNQETTISKVFTAVQNTEDGRFNFQTEDGFYSYRNGFRFIRYAHVPDMLLPTSSAYILRPVALSTYGKRIGYIVGAGDKVPEALSAMGYEVDLLTEKELMRENLSNYDAIVTGVRAYNTNPWLDAQYDKLMSYVKEGGNLIVQYNTNTQIGQVRSRIGPYNFNIGRNRITDENAQVKFLQPDHPVLNYPNKITAEDFDGWVQERSIYHATNSDPAFIKVLTMHDPGESDDDGSLIISKFGKGYFSYTGLVFFRELPAGVPGAYRLMANLIALNRKMEF